MRTTTAPRTLESSMREACSSPLPTRPPSPNPPSLALTLTIRHLPSDRWHVFSVPREWRVEQVKEAALQSFEERVEVGQVVKTADSEYQPAHELYQRRKTVGQKTTPTRKTAETAQKENERTPKDLQRDKARRSSDGGGLRAVAKAASDMLDSLRPFPSRSPRGPRFSCDDDTPPLPPLPPHLDAPFATASPSPARPSLALDDPAFPATPTRPRPSLSTAPFAASSFATEESESEAVTLTAAPTSLAERSDGRSQIPSQAPWPERATKRVERGGGTGAASKLRRLVRKDSSPQKDEGDGSSSWCLVNAVTGGYSSDQRVVGSTFVQHDLLILKPRLLLYDSPLHLLHLPYLRLPRIEVLAGPAASLTPRPASPTTPKRAKRRSLGTTKGEESFVERALEIAVEQRALAGGSQSGASAPVMVLRIYDGSSLQQTFQLPAASIQLVAAEAASSADCSLDKTPSTGHFPLPSLPLIHLELEAGESLSLRPTSTLDLQRLLDLLGEEDETSDLLYEREMERRKSIVDAAYRSHHDLPSCPPPSTLVPPPSSPVISLLPRPPVSRRRSLNDPPPVPRRPIFQKSATQVVLSRVPSSEDESSSLDRAASAETLPSSGSKFATAPSSPTLLAPATLTSASPEGASSSSSGHPSHLPASASSSALVSTPGRSEQRRLAPPLGPPPPPPRSALRPRSPFSVSKPG